MSQPHRRRLPAVLLSAAGCLCLALAPAPPAQKPPPTEHLELGYAPRKKLDLGYAPRKKGDWARAIERYRKAIRLNPRDAKAHNGLGTALYATGKLDEVI